MLGESIRTIKKHAEALLVGSKKTGLEANADKTKYMVMSRDQNAGRSHSIKTDNSPFERVEEFQHLGTTLKNENSLQEEIKSRLKSGNGCYCSVDYLLLSSLPSKNIKIKINRTAILSVVLYGCETWSLILREESRLRMFEKKVLRRNKREEVTREWRKLYNYIMRRLTICIPHPIFYG
jgi:predicted ABC-class ATPase